MCDGACGNANGKGREREGKGRNGKPKGNGNECENENRNGNGNGNANKRSNRVEVIRCHIVSHKESARYGMKIWKRLRGERRTRSCRSC